ncbi:MAG: sulfur carrier protein ThiS [Gammaproteobacteria bacterium]|nr:sulfur carrier protein ThiS [Gammaproteobacteria bacterium]
MVILVNGTRHELPAGSNAMQLIEQLGLTGKRLALEINLEIVPRSQYAAYLLSEGDRVEVVHAIGGG